MNYEEALKGGVKILCTQPEHAERLERLQEVVFPTLSPSERLRAPHYLKHLEIFPEGQFVALDGERVVGMTSTLRLNFDFEHIDHTFHEIIAEGWFTTHEANGTWLYGADIGTDPQYRGHGIARALYRARQKLVTRLGLHGQVTVGMMSGFGAVKDAMSAEEYYAQLCRGAITDPTISMQIRVGFEPRGLLANYLTDPVCGNYGVLLVLGASAVVA